MAKQYKIDAVSELVDQLKQKQNFILTNYSGIKVSALTQLRTQLKEKGGAYKVVKNNLFNLALKEAGYVDVNKDLKGPIAVAFGNEQIGDIAKVLQDFKKENEAFDYFMGIIDGVVYNEKGVKKLADLPSKEVLLSQTMSLIGGPARGIAVGMNQIMASLARGINAVAEQNAK
jgi:large subunit ribosomal protein L10